MGLKNVLKQNIANIAKEKESIKQRITTLDAVNEINKKIQYWFSTYKDDGLLQFKVIEKSFKEQGVGLLKINELSLYFANGKEVVFELDENILNKEQSFYFRVFCKNHNYGSAYIYKSMYKNYSDPWNFAYPSGGLTVFHLNKNLLEGVFEWWFKER